MTKLTALVIATQPVRCTWLQAPWGDFSGRVVLYKGTEPHILLVETAAVYPTATEAVIAAEQVVSEVRAYIKQVGL